MANCENCMEAWKETVLPGVDSDDSDSDSWGPGVDSCLRRRLPWRRNNVIPDDWRYSNTPLSNQCFMHCSASKDSIDRALRSTVIVLFEEAKTLSTSVDIAGIERVSKAHWRRLAEGYSIHHLNRFSSFHLVSLFCSASTYILNSLSSGEAALY